MGIDGLCREIVEQKYPSVDIKQLKYSTIYTSTMMQCWSALVIWIGGIKNTQKKNWHQMVLRKPPLFIDLTLCANLYIWRRCWFVESHKTDIGQR